MAERQPWRLKGVNPGVVWAMIQLLLLGIVGREVVVVVVVGVDNQKWDEIDTVIEGETEITTIGTGVEVNLTLGDDPLVRDEIEEIKVP